MIYLFYFTNPNFTFSLVEQPKPNRGLARGRCSSDTSNQDADWWWRCFQQPFSKRAPQVIPLL